MRLIIVESPTKAKTIQNILGNAFEVISSYGHVRDLPKSELGIDVAKNFEPHYIIPLKSRKHVSLLKEKARKAKEILLATDEDREGEAIAYHIVQLLKSDKTKGKANITAPFKRIAFHEITPEAIKAALKHPRDIDGALVESQKARRMLDRLVGYKLSPLLWKKIVRGISAGRVQSVALRLVVEREDERKRFIAQDYWIIEVDFEIQDPKLAGQNLLVTTLEKVNGKKLDKFALKTEGEANDIKKGLENALFAIEDITKKPWQKAPDPPFITSSLQQTAGIRLGFRASFTMSVAQRLYETGNITYMRTDAATMAQSALERAQHFITNTYGKEYAAMRQWKTKVKLAQEAHEAIRPTDFSFTPEKAVNVLERAQAKLYTLIWQRAVASQMKEALFERTKVTVNATNNSAKTTYTLGANGSRLVFDGFMKVYPVKIKDVILPAIAKDSALSLKEVKPVKHTTQPPGRFSEATLIDTLKELGIGRPSTYAPTIDVIQKRRYVEKDEQKKFAPTSLGVAVNTLLINHFPNIVDFDFTAKMEEELDEIAEGKESAVDLLSRFYGPFEKLLETKQEELQKQSFTQEKTDRTCPTCSSPVVKKLGRYGEFYSCSRFPDCKWAEPILKTIGMKCPTCKEGDIIERRTKRGKIFYGCSRYPKCTFASWQKPKHKEA